MLDGALDYGALDVHMDVYNSLWKKIEISHSKRFCSNVKDNSTLYIEGINIGHCDVEKLSR